MPAPRFHPFARLVFCALGLFAVAVGLGLMLAIGSVFTSLSTGTNDVARTLGDFQERFALPITVISYVPMLGWIWFCRTRFDRRSMVSIGLRAGRALPNFARGALVGTLAISVLWAILWLTGAISVGGWSSDALAMGAGRAALSLIAYAAIFFAVGFFEETLFRGYGLHNFKAWFGWRGAVVVQAILFAIVHLGNAAGGDAAARLAAVGALPSLFLIAVFFALSYRKTGSLWFPIGFHFAWNFCLGCLFSLPVSGIKIFHLLEVQEGNQSNWLSGGAFGAEGSLFLIPILIALIVYIRRAPDHPQAVLDLALLDHAEAPAPPLPVAPVEEAEPEEERPNRYGTKFGTSQGFSADTLRELRELQEAREREQSEAREAAKREEQARVLAAAPKVAFLEPLEIKPAIEAPVAQTASVVVVETPAPKIEQVTIPPEAPRVATVATETEKAAEVVAPKTEVVAAPKAPSDEPVKKKAAPRW